MGHAPRHAGCTTSPDPIPNILHFASQNPSRIVAHRPTSQVNTARPPNTTSERTITPFKATAVDTSSAATVSERPSVSTILPVRKVSRTVKVRCSGRYISQAP